MTAELPVVTPTMFVGIPSVPTRSQSLEGAHSEAFSTVWSVLVCSSGIVYGNSYVGSQQIDLSGFQFGQSSPQTKIIPLSTDYHHMGGNRPFHHLLQEDNHMGVHNKIQVMLELHLAIGYRYYLNNQELYIRCNNVYLRQIYQLCQLL